MKKLLTFLTILTFVTACGSKGSLSNTKFKIISGNMSDTQLTFPGGLLVMGRSLDGSQSFVLNYNPGLELELKKGAWEFATLGWIGPAPMEGNQQCSYQSMDIKTDTFVINFDMNYANCLTMQALDGSHFTDPMFYNYNSGNFNGFKKLQVKTCNSISPCVSQKAPDSFRVEIPNKLKGLVPNATMGERLASSCIVGSSVSNITPPHGGVSGFIGTRITTFGAPAPSFNTPDSIVIDSNGNYYIAEAANHAIRKLTPEGVLTTFAGKVGVGGFADGVGSSARFNTPRSIAIDANNTIYVADTGNNKIRKITSDGNVTTYAATFSAPQGITVSSYGIVYVADTANNKIRAIAADGSVSDLSGTGTAGSNDNVSSGSIVTFNNPSSLAMSLFQGPGSGDAGYLYVADTGNSIIRKVNLFMGGTTTIAGVALSVGSVDHAANPLSARFDHPSGIIVDSTGSIFVADTNNKTIRKITATSVSTVAGLAGSGGFTDGLNTAARFNYPTGLAVDSSLNLFVADSGNHIIRQISSAGEVTTIAGIAGVPGGIDSGSIAGCAGAPKSYMFDHGFGENLDKLQFDLGGVVQRRGVLSLKVDALNSNIAFAPFLGMHSSYNTLPPLNAASGQVLYFYNGTQPMTVGPNANPGSYLYFNGSNWSSFQETDSVKLLLEN